MGPFKEIRMKKTAIHGIKDVKRHAAAGIRPVFVGPFRKIVRLSDPAPLNSD